MTKFEKIKNNTTVGWGYSPNKKLPCHTELTRKSVEPAKRDFLFLLGGWLLLPKFYDFVQNAWFSTGSCHQQGSRTLKHAAFTLAEGGRRPLLNSGARHAAFTLAEILITLAVIGVVAVLVLPATLNNIQERVKKEQVRTIKYKLTQATDKMKSLDLIGPYYGGDDESTENFLNELKKHFKIVKICGNNELDKCWPSKTILLPDENGGTLKNVADLKTGSDISALTISTKNTKTMGIQTADGTSMILAYAPNCTAMDAFKTYQWSTQDNKPVTNATTNCISAVFDINGGKKPNRLGNDVRTLNSLFGYKQYEPTFMTKEECEKSKHKYGINGCYHEQDHWAGAVKKCADIGLHLPDMQTLANIAGANYGRTDIGPHTLIMANGAQKDDGTPIASGDCKNYYQTHNYGNRLESSDVICIGTEITGGIGYDSNAAIQLSGFFWSSSEISAMAAERREIFTNHSTWYGTTRHESNFAPLCVGD